jgi:hypothetical protein
MEKHFDKILANAMECLGRINACCSTFTLVLAYLAWLCALETFGIIWSIVDDTTPQDGPTVGLPLGIGVIQLRLCPD